jgi:hypothetical protein
VTLKWKLMWKKGETEKKSMGKKKKERTLYNATAR